MSRQARSDLKTNLFHIMVQGINKSYIFNDSIDIKYYIKLLYELNNQHNIQIIAYCVMNNHTHILIKSENIDEMSKFMKRVNVKFSRYYNKKHNRVGYVFRDRFKSQGIYSEKHMYNCIRYIYENPVKAGICKSPNEYPYSNYNKKIDIYNNEDCMSFIDTEEDTNMCCEFMLKEILKKNNIDLIELKNNKDLLRNIVKIMIKQYKYSLRNISEKLGIGRETIRKLNVK
ncbi:MAG TPA: hypothetical protein DEP51_06275 [Clostridiales bacterium]|nr:hypothetical protein [Clostridiales bacterium]